MRTIYQKMKVFLLQHEVWLFLSVLLFFSYAFMQSSGQLTWSRFYTIFAALVLLFSPLLLFTYWRRQWALPSRNYRVLWGLAFLVMPVIAVLYWPSALPTYFSGSGEVEPPIAAEKVGGIAAWLSLLLLELRLLWQKRHGQTKVSNWLLNRPVQHWALLVLAVFAILLVPSSNYFQEYVSELSWTKTMLLFFSAIAQTFIIYLSYYLIYYVHHHFLFNVLLRQKGVLYYFLGSVGFLLLFVPLQGEFIRLFPAVDQIRVHPLGVVPDVFSDFSFVLPVSFFLLSLPFIIGIEWYRQANALSQLQQEKTSTELQLLRQQINPHFFFNTLNNLYAMSLTQERETPNTILQLSELMRYVIYKGQKDAVPLRLEVNYLRDYIDLQKIRLHQKLDLSFQVNIADEECLVPPLLFIILLENAFKHGIESAGQASFLYLELEQKDNYLRFRCHNSLDRENKAPNSGGLGLNNLRRRLAVAFPDRHQLYLQNLETEYIAELTLEL